MSETKSTEPKISRRSFVWAGAYAVGVFGGVKWLASRRDIDGTPWPFRKALEVNEGIWGDAFDPRKKTHEFPESSITATRANGTDGLDEDFDPATWKLTVQGVHGQSDPVVVTLDELKAMPSKEMITEFCCIEGWSMIQKWKGVRLIDFMKKYPPETHDGSAPDPENHLASLVRYVGMETPNAGYYVGLDMASATHDQTLLCYEMNGAPLTLEHGAPLRLVIPVKYGVKNLKRIGTITYTDTRPKDFWAEQGYDWFAGL